MYMLLARKKVPGEIAEPSMDDPAHAH